MEENEQLAKGAVKLTLRYHAAEAKRNWRFALPALLLPGIGAILIFYLPPLVIAKLIDAYTAANGGHVAVGWYVALFAGSWLLGEILFRIAFHAVARAEVRGIESLYTIALQKLAEKDMAFFSNNFAGSLTKRAMAFARNHESISDKLYFQIVPSLVTLAFVTVVLWQYSPWYVLLLYASILLVIVTVTPLIRKRSKMVAVRTAAATRLTGHVADVVSNISAVKAFAREKQELHTHRALTVDFMKKTLRTWDYHNLGVNMAVTPIYVGVNAAGLALAVYLTQATGAGAGVIVVSLAYISQFTRIFWDFNPIYRELESAVTEAAEFGNYLLTPPAIQDVKSPIAFAAGKGAIDFDNVSFDYHRQKAGRKTDLLFENFTLSIKPGEKVGLVGPSGGGKTTISKLVLRFMDVSAGRILIDGQDIALAKQTDVRNAISYVPQDPAMFHRSLSDNIRYGRTDATDKEVLAAAKAAHADEFINRLKNKYDTMVGERGTKLSGGQRQRVAIARAILRDAPILILDEATSALDSESEVLIQDALRTLMEHKTAIVIAHRLSTIQRMDRIVVINKGRIVEQGSHKELLAAQGLYARLWAHQSGGFIEE